MKRTLLICLSIIMIALVGCKKDENTWGKLKETNQTLVIGDSLQLTFESDGNKCPQWSSSDPFVADVDYKGMVRTRHIGTTVITVNNLSCEIKVVDGYINLFDEARIDWTVDADDITKYEASMRGTGMTELEYDTVVHHEIQYHNDTAWNADSTRYTITSHADTITVIDHIYVQYANYDYSASLDDIMFDGIRYQFAYSKDKKGEFTDYLAKYVAYVSDSYSDIITDILKNRFYTTNDPNCFFYYISATKICRIFVSEEGGKTMLTYIPEK